MSYSPPTLARTHCVLFYFQAWSSSSRSLLWRYTASPRGVMTVLATARGYVGGGAVGVVQQRGVPSMPCDNLLVLVICACVYFSYVLCGTVSITVSYLYVAHTYTHTHTPPHTHTHTHTPHTHTHTHHTHTTTHTPHTHHTHTHTPQSVHRSGGWLGLSPQPDRTATEVSPLLPAVCQCYEGCGREASRRCL